MYVNYDLLIYFIQKVKEIIINLNFNLNLLRSKKMDTIFRNIYAISCFVTLN